MSDALERATRALKESEDAAPPTGDPETRVRVLERATFGQRQRKVSRAILLPFAAAFVLLGTWAAASGSLAKWLSSEAPDVPSAPAAAPTTTSTKRGGKATPANEVLPETTSETVSEPSPGPAPGPPPSAPVQEPAPVAPRHSAPAAATPARKTANPDLEKKVLAPTPAAEPTPTQAAASTSAPLPNAAPPNMAQLDPLYADAHRAHFEQHDCTRALAAWDRYLADSSSKRFVPEARYNRAICLVRLGRKDEARAALKPFADGAYGGYRRTDATRLIEALGEPSQP